MVLSWGFPFFFLAYSLAAAPTPPSSFNIISYLTNVASPAPCHFYCAPLRTLSSTCGDDSSCFCSSLTASAIYTCASCQLIGKTASWGDLEYAIGEYSTECSSAGTPISYLTLIPPC